MDAPRQLMYSTEWFETFAATVPASINDADLDGIAAVLPCGEHARLLDIGCGIGRIAGPLAARGYTVTGIDVSLDALRIARQAHPAVRYVGLDQRHIGTMRWVFDGALFLWNSLGFVDRDADLETLAGVAGAVRRGGKVVFDMYHPDWLEQNQRAGEPDTRGAAAVRRWLQDGRSCHEIRYANGRVDDIHFNVYRPEELGALARRAGLQPAAAMLWWKPDVRPSAEFPRYQMICARPG